MNNTDRALLQCLCGDAWDEEIDLKELLDAACSQAVAGLAAHNILSRKHDLPNKRKIPFVTSMLLAEKHSKLLNDVTVDLAQLLNQSGIHYAVIKGQVVAARYASPMMRQVGDVDFYVAKQDFEKAASLLKQSWGVKIRRVENDHHWSFCYKEVPFEMHYRCELFGKKSHQEFFDKLIEHDVVNNHFTIDINGVAVQVLSPETEIAYVFKHLFNHLIVEGVGLKQVMDLKVLLEKKDAYSTSKLEDTFKRIGYWTAFTTMVTLLSDYLGFVGLPSMQSNNHKDARRMMNEILKSGNFGRKTYNNTKGIMKSVETALRAFMHLMLFGKLAPAELMGLVPTRIGISMRKYIQHK